MSIELALFAYRVRGRGEWWVHRARMKKGFSVVVKTGRVEWGITVVVGDYR